MFFTIKRYFDIILSVYYTCDSSVSACTCTLSDNLESCTTALLDKPPNLDLHQFGAQPVSFLDLMHAILHTHDAAHLGLTNFIRLSLRGRSPALCTELTRVPTQCPVPYQSGDGRAQQNPRPDEGAGNGF